jgi:hydroxymethylbilane synthase
LAQSRLFAEELTKRHPQLRVELKAITTSGDRFQDRLLSELGGKGLFVKEIEEALLAGQVDFAVHSLKDVPAQLPQGLSLGCFPERKDPEDLMVLREGSTLRDLSQGARVGTSSLRRRLQIQRLRPDLRFEMLRGNIDSRLRRLRAGDFDAVVLARAGLQRLGVTAESAFPLPIVPAPGQGTLAVEVRSDDAELMAWLRSLHHPATERVSLAERYVMRELGGSCNLPLGAFAEIHGEVMKLSVYLATPDGARHLEETQSGPANAPVALAESLVEKIWQNGGREIVAAIHKL